jgi:uncharacterized membrane protein
MEMSIFRTIKKVRDCEACAGEGTDPVSGNPCLSCGGTGQVEVLARVSQAAATRAQAAAKELPPRQRHAARERLEDHEPEPEGLPGTKKDRKSRVGKDIVDEDAT